MKHLFQLLSTSSDFNLLPFYRIVNGKTAKKFLLKVVLPFTTLPIFGIIVLESEVNKGTWMLIL
ncbi:TPA: hypothetical protein ACGXKU_005348 [Bacillus cereus]